MITIITDSTAYLKKEEAKLLGVRIVPMQYTFGGKSYYETYSDRNGSYESLISSGVSASTSQPNTAAFLSCFVDELNHGNEVLCITISSRLSGAYGSAYLAAKQIDGNVSVFDSHLTAGGLYLMIRAARKLILRGLALDEIVRELSVLRSQTVIVFSVDDLTPLRNSGRMGLVRKNINTILNIKPILLCRDGAIVADGVARGTPDIIRRLTQKIPPDATEIIINYIRSTKTGYYLYTTIKELFPRAIVRVQKMGPVLGIHLGLGVVAVSFVRK